MINLCESNDEYAWANNDAHKGELACTLARVHAKLDSFGTRFIGEDSKDLQKSVGSKWESCLQKFIQIKPDIVELTVLCKSLAAKHKTNMSKKQQIEAAKMAALAERENGE